MKLQYKLEEEEIREALRCLDYKQESGMRKVHLYLVSGMGMVVLFMYIRNPGQFFLFLLLLLIVLLLFYMSYGAVIRRERVAKKMMRTSGEYQVELSFKGVCYGEAKEQLSFSQEKVGFIDSKRLYIIKAGREVFSIPKRILTEKQVEELGEIMGKTGGNIVRIIVEEE